MNSINLPNCQIFKGLKFLTLCFEEAMYLLYFYGILFIV